MLQMCGECTHLQMQRSVENEPRPLSESRAGGGLESAWTQMGTGGDRGCGPGPWRKCWILQESKYVPPAWPPTQPGCCVLPGVWDRHEVSAAQAGPGPGEGMVPCGSGACCEAHEDRLLKSLS